MESFKASIVKIRTKKLFNSVEMKTLESLVAQNQQTINRSNFKEFVSLVGKNGCAFCPSTFNDRITRKENFEQSQLLALYFNNLSGSDMMKISFDEVRDRAKRYDLPILFAYDSYSPYHSNNPKRFCMVFLSIRKFLPTWGTKEKIARQRRAY